MRALQNLTWFAFVWAFLVVGFAPSVLLLQHGLSPLLLPFSLAAGVLALLLVAWVVFALVPRPKAGAHAVASADGARWTLYSGVSNFYLKVFQPLLFLNDVTRFLVLRALHCHVSYSSWITSRAHLGDPRHIRIGPRSVVGDNAMLVPAFMPKPGRVIIADISVGADALVAGLAILSSGVQIGDRSIVQAKAEIFPGVRIGNDTKIGVSSRIEANIGARVRIGRDCYIKREVADDEQLPDGTVC